MTKLCVGLKFTAHQQMAGREWLAAVLGRPSGSGHCRRLDWRFNTVWTEVANAGELMDALASGTPNIVVAGTLQGTPSVTLPPGTTRHGGTLLLHNVTTTG